MMERLEELAAGATELQVRLRRGDIDVRSGDAWGLQWSSETGEEPEVRREGWTLSIRSGATRNGRDTRARLDVKLIVPQGVDAAELTTGWGSVNVDSLRGRLKLATGHGAVSFRCSRGVAEVTTGNGELSIQGYEGRLTATTGNGRARIQGLRGDASLRTGNGGLEVLDSEGRLRVKVGNGDVLISGVGGEAELMTGHGRVEINASRNLAVQATTAHGSIHVDRGIVRSLQLRSTMGSLTSTANLAPGKYDLSTSVGDISIEVPADARARVDAQTSFGQVNSDFPLVRVGRSGPMGFGGVRMVGSTGEGEPELDISLRSGKGRLSLLKAAPQSPAPVKTVPPVPVEPVRTAEAEEAPQDPTLALLQAVARGELSPQEADDLLSGRR